ncbi:MAG: DUF4129 domain-containing protein [Nocardioides sp.]
MPTNGDAEQGAGRSPVPTVTAVLATTLIVVLLATWAASIGADGVLRGDGNPADRASEPTTTAATPTPTPSEAVESDRSDGDEQVKRLPDWLRTVAVLAQIATAVVALYLLYLLLRRIRRSWLIRRRRPGRAADVDFEVLDVAEEAAAEMARDADDQRARLLEGEPRNAIVECWHRFEVQAQRAGVAREEWETSSEFTMRLLDLVAADPAAVSSLAQLYREARFSDHLVDEDARGRALSALDEIHAGLGRRSVLR